MHKTVALLMMLAVVAGCSRSPGVAQERPLALSARSNTFVKTAKAELTDFGFRVVYVTYEGPKRFGVAFLTALPEDASQRSAVTLVQIDEAQASRLVDYFARSGMLDKTDMPPPGEPASGWNVSLDSNDAHALWLLGLDIRAILDAGFLREVGKTLDPVPAKHWQTFLNDVKKREGS